MILERKVTELGVEFISPDGGYRLARMHTESSDCRQHGCVIHNPSRNWPLWDAPYNWREDRGLMERICVHGVGHPDADTVAFIRRARGAQFASVEASHGCCGCCR